MNVHVLVPFYRKYLYKTLVSYYEKHNIIWHPICDEIDIEPFKNNTIEWIEPFLCPHLEPGEQCYKKFNDFIDGTTLIDEDYYGFAGDDDMFEPGFFDKLRKKTFDIIFSSSYKGDTIPNDGGEPHPPGSLITKEIGDVRVCNIGLGMFFVKGKILKNIRFKITHGWDDGRFAESLLELGSIEFMTDSFLFGNYFQPGRFTNPNYFLKVNWELPKFL